MKLKFRAEPKDVIIFIVFAIFLLYLVAIAVLNLHSLTVEARFWGLNPFPAFSPEYISATLIFYLLALIGAFMSASSYFFEREKGLGFEPGKKKEEGYVKFASASEMKKSKDIRKIVLAEDDYEYAGIPIILDEKEAYVDDGESHSLIIGGTGSGKTECIMKPMSRILAKKGESMIFTDPKGELYRDLGGLLKDKGYNIIVLNFRDPLRGNSWNPLSLPYKYYKENKMDKAKELVEDLARNIVVDPENQAEPFWEETAAAYFAGLIIGLFKDAPSEEYVNINSVNLMATLGEEPFTRAMTYAQKYFKDKGETSDEYVSASATISAPDDTRNSILSTFKSKVRIFASRESLSEMLSVTDFDLSQVGKKKTAVFLEIHDEKKTYHALVTIFLKQIYESLVDVASSFENLRLPIRTNFMLDEFANMPPLTDVDSMVTASRSRNMRFNFIIQNFSQLDKQYGSNMAETIKGNCNNIHFLTTTELKALEEISRLVGDKKGNKDKSDEPTRPLMTVSDLQKLNQFEFLILRLRCNPFKIQFKADFEINKKNGWGVQYDPAEFPYRESNNIKIFNIKEFVDKNAEKNGEGSNNSNPGVAGMRRNPIMPPFMMNQPQNTINNAKQNKFNSIMDMDEFIKNIDSAIEKLEKQEKLEKEAEKKKIQTTLKTETVQVPVVEPLENTSLVSPKPQNIEQNLEKNTEPTQAINSDAIKNIIDEIETLENKNTKEENEVIHSVKSDTHENKEIVDNEKKKQEEEIKKLLEEIEQKNKDEHKDQNKNQIENISNAIERPKINVDADSIVVDENITDDQFFDDFFSDDEDK